MARELARPQRSAGWPGADDGDTRLRSSPDRDRVRDDVVPTDNILYSGLAPGLVGVWQINLRIPADAVVGSSVPIKVFEGSIPNTDPAASLGNTTIAIK